MSNELTNTNVLIQDVFTLLFQVTVLFVSQIVKGALHVGEQDDLPGGDAHQEPEGEKSRYGHITAGQFA